MPKEQYMCQLCANHGDFEQPKKGHKRKCPHRDCPCNLCALNTRRRKLDQMERHLRLHNTSIGGTSGVATTSMARIRNAGVLNGAPLPPKPIAAEPTASDAVSRDHKTSKASANQEAVRAADAAGRSNCGDKSVFRSIEHLIALSDR